MKTVSVKINKHVTAIIKIFFNILARTTTPWRKINRRREINCGKKF